MQECAHKLESHTASCGIKSKIKTVGDREAVIFDCNSLLKFMFKIFHLDTIAEQEAGVELGLTLYGAKFANHMAHVTCGIKVLGMRERTSC